MVVFPFCKINLGLSVLSKRDDGYHNLDTCFYPVPWTDVLEIIIADQFSFTTSGNDIPGDLQENLCVKAYQLLKSDFDLAPVSIHLHKIIPSEAGLGGGSSDAAQTLKMLDTIFSLDIPMNKLREYASVLGSDCTFFTQDKAMIGEGRGEILKEIDLSLKDSFMVIIKPDIHVSTREAFSGIIPKASGLPVAEILSLPVAQWRGLLSNDFEETVFRKHPALSLMKDRMYEAGALYASMTGTGSAIFGIFESEVEVLEQFPGGVKWSGFLD